MRIGTDVGLGHTKHRGGHIDHDDGFGGGVVGINIARAIKRRFADSCITVIEKETAQELNKYSRTHLIHQASTLWEGIGPEYFQKWGQPGIRAQLINMKLKKMEMDFVVEGNDRSMHVLNAVSPGFTCSLPFSEYVCERISAEIGSS